MRQRLLLDEMHAPVVAVALRERGHDVVCVAADPDLRAGSDPEIFAWASREGRRVVTENVKDFRHLLMLAADSGQACAGVLFTSSRTFTRSRRDPGPLIDALDAWLQAAARRAPPIEDWLQPAPDR